LSRHHRLQRVNVHRACSRSAESELAERLRTPLFEPGGAFAELSLKVADTVISLPDTF
jgi:hypothetical protein